MPIVTCTVPIIFLSFSRWKPLLIIIIYCLITQMQLSGGPPYCHSIHEPLTLRSQPPPSLTGARLDTCLLSSLRDLVLPCHAR